MSLKSRGLCLMKAATNKGLSFWGLVVAVVALLVSGIVPYLEYKRDRDEKSIEAEDRKVTLIAQSIGMYNVILNERISVGEQLNSLNRSFKPEEASLIISELEGIRVRRFRWAEGHVELANYDDKTSAFRAGLRLLSHLTQVVDDQASNIQRLIREREKLSFESVSGSIKDYQRRVDYALREVRLMIDVNNSIEGGDMALTSCENELYREGCLRELKLYIEGIPDEDLPELFQKNLL